MYFHWILAAALWLSIIPDAQATKQHTSIEDAGEQLEEINLQIQSLNKSNLEQEGELGKLQLNLQKFDKLIESASISLNELAQNIHTTQISLRELDKKKTLQAKNIHQHKSKLAEQLRGLHRSSEMVRLLGLAKPQSLNQYLINQTHFRYLQKARRTKIIEIQQQQRRLQQTKQDFTAQLTKFEQLSRQERKTEIIWRKKRAIGESWLANSLRALSPPKQNLLA